GAARRELLSVQKSATATRIQRRRVGTPVPEEALRSLSRMIPAGKTHATPQWLTLIGAAMVLALSSGDTVAPSMAPSAAPSAVPSAAPVGFIGELSNDPTKFNYDVVFTADVPDLVQAAILEAAAAMESIITGDVPDVPAFTPDTAPAYCAEVLGSASADEQADCAKASVLGWFGVALLNYKGQTDLNLYNTPFYDGPIDDMLTFVYMDNSLTLESGTLMYSGGIFRRTEAQDPLHRRPFVSILGINAHPEAVAYLVSGGALKKTFMHEMIHSVGVGNAWPTAAGCGNEELCHATVLKQLGTEADKPVTYTPAGAAAPCKADANYQKLCAAAAWCTALNGDSPLLVAANGDSPLLVETNAPTTKDNPNFGSNCGHWPEKMLPAEIISTMAEGVKPTLGPRLFLTEVNYLSDEIDGFDLIDTRLRELNDI
ncbi:hypothetical protein JKP88DRAFT_305843, partial [Tribonema minus]